MDHYRISSTTTRRGRVTEVAVYVGADQAGLPGFYFQGHGSALRSKNDVRLDGIGETIALGRALQDFGRQIEASGHAQCVTKDEYQRVTNLMEQRPPSASRAMREFVRDNLQDPDSIPGKNSQRQEHAAPSDGNLAPCSCGNPESHWTELRSRYLPSEA